MSRGNLQAARADGRILSDGHATTSEHAEQLRPAVSGLGGRDLRSLPARNDGDLLAAERPDTDHGALSGRRGLPSGSGYPYGGFIGKACGNRSALGPDFDIKVSPDGYAWWYVDGVSADGQHAISLIGFIGSVFSPWYAWSGRRDPANNCCLNVALYGKGARWTMTDRGRTALRQSADTLEIGPSAMHWTGNKLVIYINEISTPHCQRIEGTVTVTPSAVTDHAVALTPQGSHVWRPFAPRAHIEVALNRPGWGWNGHGYFDANFGTTSLEKDFRYWTWSRFPTDDGAVCLYDIDRRDGSQFSLAQRFGADGSVTGFEPPPKANMRRTLWGLRRETRADTGVKPRQSKHMLDAPFYCRAGMETQIGGARLSGVHEALDLDRFASPLLKPMLAVRVPRRPGWSFRD